MAWPQEDRGSPIAPDSGLRGLAGSILTGGFTLLSGAWLRYGHLLGAGLVCVFLASVVTIGWLRPDRNWDMLAYLAAAWQPDYPVAADLHAKVFETVRAGVDPAEFQALTSGDAWRERQFSDPDAFVSMIGMYDVKWLYVELLRLVMPFTGPIKAGLAINTAAVVLFGAVLLWWLSARRLLNFAPLAVAGLVIVGFPAMAIAKTPDMLTVALVTGGFLLLDRDRLLAGTAAIAVSVLVRPDSAAISGLLMVAAWLWRDRMAAAATLGLAASLAAYLFASSAGNHPGWWPHLWFSTFHIQETMAGFAPDFSPRVYAAAFAWNIVRSVFENTWLAVYGAMLMIWGALHANGFRMQGRQAVLLSAALGAIAAKFALFPLHDGRTYMPLLVPAALLLLAGWRAEKAVRPAGPR